jgi:hypothetical protein
MVHAPTQKKTAHGGPFCLATLSEDGDQIAMINATTPMINAAFVR